MMNIENNGIRDSEGYVISPEDWNPALAEQIAREEDLVLSPHYWRVITFMRYFWTTNRVAPDVRHVIEHLSSTGEFDKRQAKKHIFGLFPYGYVKQACKIAGMQRPRAWSTG